MGKRSPILGFNHNVRHRGLVFHVQTEDSGIVNPHIFTHLFHGGTILSSRKMVYDPDSAEDVVKSLMQAQHKAVLKDLKRQAFDDKIDQYFGDRPDLLPRDRAEEEPDEVVPSGPEAVPRAITDNPEAATTPISDVVVVSHAATREDETPVAPSVAVLAQPPHGTIESAVPPVAAQGRGKRPTPGIDIPLVRFNTQDPPREVIAERVPDDPIQMSRAPTEQASPAPPAARPPLSPLPLPPHRVSQAFPAQPRSEPGADPRGEVRISAAFPAPNPDPRSVPAIHAPPPPTPPAPAPAPSAAERSISAAFDAIMDALPSADAPDRVPPPTRPPMLEISDEVAHVHAPALASVPTPPGAQPERVGTYAQYKKAGSGSQSVGARPPTEKNAVVKDPNRGSSPAVSRTPTPVVPGRTPTPPPIPRGGAPPVPPGAVARAPTPPGSRTPTPQRPGSQSGTTQTPAGARRPSSGVVVSRPAVIVGAPPKIVGAPAAPVVQPSRAPTRPRKAREDNDGGLFGQDLISEKSLDEVILAYLSEDSKDDD